MVSTPRRTGPLAAALLLGACSTNGDSTDAPTIHLHADYPVYDTDELVGEATLIVEGTVLRTEPTVITPQYSGDSPEENPLAGLSEAEQKRAIEEDDGILATAVSLRVDVVHEGTAHPGEEITVVQTGGVFDGVTYQVEGEAMLAVEGSYLLFARDSLNGAYAILGGSAGTYVESRAGVFTASEPEIAPTRQLTTSQVAELTDQS